MVEVDIFTDSNIAGILSVLMSPEQVICVWHALPSKLQLTEQPKINQATLNLLKL